MRINSPWTPLLTAQLCNLWEANMSGSQIGRALGQSRGSVLGKVYRLKLKPRRTKTNRFGAINSYPRNRAKPAAPVAEFSADDLKAGKFKGRFP